MRRCFVLPADSEAATASAVSEAVVNLGSSIYLANRFGAIGVAFGTVLGSIVGVALHFVVPCTSPIKHLRSLVTAVSEGTASARDHRLPSCWCSRSGGRLLA